MKHVRSLLMAVALAAFSVGPVSGLDNWGSTSPPYYVGGNSFATTASISVSFSSSLGQYVITVQVANWGEYGEVFKAIGLINVPAVLTFDVTGSSAPPGWSTPANELGGAGLPNNTYAYKAPPPAPTTGLQYGQSGTFVFKLDGSASETLVQNIGVGIHAISGPSNCSTKLCVINGEVIDNADLDSYERCGQTVVPEPSTVVLLGTGLAGLLGVAWRRRREDED